MIKHVVMFKLKDDNPPDAKETMRTKLMELPPAIDVIREFEVGVNIGASSKPYDLVVYSVFDSLDDVALFRKHPKHVEVVDAIRPLIDVSGTVDYEV